MHAEIVIADTAAGKHIYCEKPLAMDVAKGERMVAAVEQAGVKTQMTFNFRYFSAVLHARQLVEQGFLGRIFYFTRSLLPRQLHRSPEAADLAAAEGHSPQRTLLRHRLPHPGLALFAVGQITTCRPPWRR